MVLVEARRLGGGEATDEAASGDELMPVVMSQQRIVSIDVRLRT